MPIGFKIHARARKVEAAVVERYRDIAVANISDSMARMAAGGARLRPLHGGGGLCGPALTVRTRPGDNLMIHAALDRAEPGDVIVVDAGGDLTNALMGELMFSHARAVGVAGVVLNGAIRDSGWARANTFPVFAAGITHRGPYKDGPGEVNVAVALDGMVIAPGDLIVGDDDGVVCVPQADVEAVYAAARAKQDRETALMAAILAGTSDRAWVQRALEKAGCEGL